MAITVCNFYISARSEVEKFIHDNNLSLNYWTVRTKLTNHHLKIRQVKGRQKKLVAQRLKDMNMKSDIAI